MRAYRLLLGAALGVAGVGCAVEEPPHERVDEADDAIEVCFDDVVHGIDVSYYQGDIDWNAVAGAGYRFAITRINHSDFMDPKFEQNWAGIQSVGMLRGAYQYFEPDVDVAWQAQVVIDAVGKLGPGDLPCVIDVESTGENGVVPPAQIAQAVGEWLDLVEAGTGKRPIIYTGKYFWQDNVGSAAYADYPLWHAQYPNACQPPAMPPPDCSSCANIADQWGDITVWQYSSSGSVPGIAGNVDLNVFNGSYEDLVAFAAQGGGYGAQLVSVDVPSTVLPGEAFTARVTVTNTGGAPFDASTRLGTTEPRDRESPFSDASWPSANRPAAVTETVAPGAEHTFEFTLHAPTELGTFTEHFGLVQEGVAWFGDQGGPADGAIQMIIQVVDGPPAGSSGAGAGSGGEGGGGGPGGEGADDDAGCDCSTPGGAPSRTPFAPLAFAAVGAALARLQKRRRWPA